MADESSKKHVLQIWPCEPKDYNRGRCRMDTETMKDLGVIVGSPIRIRTSKKYVYCSVWPRENVAGPNVIQFDDVITLDKQTSDLALSSQILSLPEEICRLVPVEASVVTVAVSLKDIENMNSTSSKTLYEKQLGRRIKIFIKGLTVTKGCTIKPRHFRNKGHLLNTISSIAIEDISPKTQRDSCAFVSDNSRIQIKSVKMANSVDDDSRITMAGLDEAAQMLQEMLTYPFDYPESFAHIGLECPKGILLQGAPGVGKTLLVRNVTAECNAQLITLNSTDVFGPHSGESEENLRKTFEKAWLASKSGPCVLFIDELDALCPKRGTSSNEEENRIVAQLLTLMDGIKSRGKLVVIGATNRPNAIDSALRRPGRFDREVVIGVPSAVQRLAILKAHTKHIQLDKDVDLPHLAEITIGYVGADLASLCREAAFTAMKRSFQEISLKRENDIDGLIKMSDFQLAMCHIIPSTHRGMEGLVDVHPISWSNIGGYDKVKQALQQAIEWPLKYPEAFSRLGLQRPRGVLLYGPPGCCKTTLVRALATSCHCTFLSLSCAQLYSPYVGDAERMIREVFLKARSTAPSILFLDELDSIASKRSENSGSDVTSRLLASLLNEMDGVGVSANIYDANTRSDTTEELVTNTQPQDNKSEPRDNKTIPRQELKVDSCEQRLLRLQNVKDLILVAATNRPGAIDEALLRPGRIDRMVYVPPPDRDARLEVLKVHTRSSPLSEDVDLNLLAEKTEMFSGADLENLCREAALFALEEGITASIINHKHFQKALSTVKPSLTTEQLNYFKKW